MTDEVLGWGMIALLATMVAAVALLWRRRPPEAVVTADTVRGQRGLAIHPWRGHWFSTAVAWLLLALLVIWGAVADRVQQLRRRVLLGLRSAHGLRRLVPSDRPSR